MDERKALVWWDEKQAMGGHDVPDFVPDRPPSYRRRGAHGRRGDLRHRSVHHAGRRQGVAVRPGGPGGRPAARTLRAAGVPFGNLLYGQQPTRPGKLIRHPQNRYQPSGDQPGAGVFPYVTTTYRLTEHHTAGGMSRFLPYLSELQPAFFCEVSPQLAAERGLEHLGWATIITARAAIEARVLVTERIRPLRYRSDAAPGGASLHWGPNGYTTGDTANELAHLALDPNVHIQEVKAMACDIRPGRRPRGPALRDLVRQYQQRAGITDETGTEM